MPNIKLYLKILIASLSVLAIFASATAQQKSVAVTAIVDHPSLEAVRDGIKETLAQAGYVNGENPGDIAPVTQEKLQMNLNLKAAQRQGVVFSEDLLKDADIIIE